MNKLQLALRGLVLTGIVGSAAACNSDLLTPTDSGVTSSALPGSNSTPVTADDNPPAVEDHTPSNPDDSSARGAASGTTATAIAGTLRLRCERRSGRSKISVDGNNLTPRNGSFRARVSATGGTVTSAAHRAVGDEAEFDFDSERDDIAAGATRISASFIKARSGPDVTGEILNAQGVVVAKSGADCRVR